MKSTELITVFNFREYASGSDLPPLSPYKATRESILRTPKCVVLEGTGEEVPRDALDALGRYRRIATGWGELSIS